MNQLEDKSNDMAQLMNARLKDIKQILERQPKPQLREKDEDREERRTYLEGLRELQRDVHYIKVSFPFYSGMLFLAQTLDVLGAIAKQQFTTTIKAI